MCRYFSRQASIHFDQYSAFTVHKVQRRISNMYSNKYINTGHPKF